MKRRQFLPRFVSAILAWMFFLDTLPFEHAICVPRALASGPTINPNQPPKCSSQKTSKPVYMFNGEKNLDELLTELPEPVEPLRLSVMYFSQDDTTGLFGPKWHLNWERTARLEGGYLCYGCPPPPPPCWYQPYEVTITEPGKHTITYIGNNGRCVMEQDLAKTLYSTDGWNSEARIKFYPDDTIERDLACGSTEIYDLYTGRLIAYRDRGGNTTQFDYNGKLSTITDPLGRTYRIDYTDYALGTNINSIVEDWPGGRRWSFKYHVPPGGDAERLSSVDFPDGHTKYFWYGEGAWAFLVTRAQWDSEPPYMKIVYGNNSGNKVETETLIAGDTTNVTSFTYSTTENGKKTVVTYGDGGQEIYRYDTLDRLRQFQRVRQSAGGSCPETSWSIVTNTGTFTDNERGQSTNTTSSVGLTTESSFNNYGLMLTNTETDTSNNVSKTWIYTYDPSTNGCGCGKSLHTVQDPNGNVTTVYYEFDEASMGDLNGDGDTGNRPLPIKIEQPAVTNALTGQLENPTTYLTYDGMGRVRTLIDASSRTNSFTYDTGKSRPVMATVSAGDSNLTYQLSYNTLEQLTQIITPTGWTNTLGYDALGRLTNYTSNLSSLPTIGLSHDQWDNVTAMQATPGSDGGVGGSIQAVYDALGALTAVTNQLQYPTSVHYNNQRKVERVSRPLSRVDQYQYRADGLLQKMLDALTNSTDFCYDDFGRVKRVRDANGHSYQFDYDAWNRLTKQTFEYGTYEQYGYDGLDHLTSWRNRAGQMTTYQYDGLGRLAQENRPEGTWTYRYLLTGELKEVRFDGEVTSWYAYDPLGRLLSQYEYGDYIHYTYDLEGRRSSVTYPDGWRIGEVRDAAGRLTKITSADGQTEYFHRIFDGMGRVKQDRWFTDKVVKTYLYDAAGQLTNWVVSTTNGWSQSRALRYDAGGRISTQAVNGAVSTNIYDQTDQLLSSSGSYSYSATYDAVGNRQTADGWTYGVNALNQYTYRTRSGSTQNLSYDDNGNVSSFNGVTLEHDSQGQLVGANGDVGLGYDYRRLRVGESVYYDDEDWETLSFTYDARGNLLDRYDDWMYDEFQYVYADGIDEVVLERSGDYYGMEVYALVTDHLGSVVRRFNQDGSLSVGGEYHPFGDPPVLLGDVSGRLWFTGREYDQETGLYYYRNRWYSTELGRFLEPDPIGLAGWDLNLYRYAWNNPVDGADPLGLCSWRSLLPPPGSFGRFYLPWLGWQVGIGLAYGGLIDRRLSEIERLLRERGIPGERYWFPILPLGIGAFLIECDPCTGTCTRRFIPTGYGSPGFIPPGTRIPWEPCIA